MLDNSLKIKTFVFFIAITTIAIASCKKGGTPTPTNPVKKTGIDVYVVGSIIKSTGFPKATYWKNGVEKYLVSDTVTQSVASGIVIKDTDVYISGTINGVATYWKNGVAKSLSKSAEALSITINGSDIYVTGCIYTNSNYVAVYWKNGALVRLADTTEMSFPGSITVNGGDLYVAGIDYSNPKNSFFTFTANLVYWKNGIEHILSTTTVQPSSIGIAFNGSDMYITGSMDYSTSAHTQATYWKNTSPNVLTNVPDNETASASAITVNNGNLYVVGNINNKAVYWDNNNAEHDLTNGSIQYLITGIAFSGTDMYISGWQNSTISNAVYWKNGTMVNLSSNTSYSAGIGIVKF